VEVPRLVAGSFSNRAGSGRPSAIARRAGSRAASFASTACPSLAKDAPQEMDHPLFGERGDPVDPVPDFQVRIKGRRGPGSMNSNGATP